MKRETGHYKTLGATRFFIPAPLPPDNPPLELDAELTKTLEEASQALKQLNGMGAKLPGTKRFIKAYVMKEALLSSAIEGIHTTVTELFTQPLAETRTNKETSLVHNYTKALDVALTLLKTNGLPLSERVIKEAHKVLLPDESDPGCYRKQSVRVGDLIPSPAQDISELMGRLEQFINTPSTLSPLLKTGLAHVQFETIHPFIDGNGRIGRVLVVLMLVENGLLDEPILYPSYYFKKHRFLYYHWLDKVRTEGDFEGWLKYYLAAIKESALDAFKRANDIILLETLLRTEIANGPHFARIRKNAERTLEILFLQPVIDASYLSSMLNRSYRIASKILETFSTHGIVVEYERDNGQKQYHFTHYISLLEKE